MISKADESGLPETMGDLKPFVLPGRRCGGDLKISTWPEQKLAEKHSVVVLLFEDEDIMLLLEENGGRGKVDLESTSHVNLLPNDPY